MSTFRKFEDIDAWQRARHLTTEVYRITQRSYFSRDFPLRDQLRRASLSIMLNIAEGFGRRGDREFGRYLSIANGSAAELQAGLYVALDQGALTPEEFRKLYDQIDEIGRMLTVLRKYLRISH